ncbi:MAG: hypothetical protein HYY26_04260 [Acidobacteria bacterium]|nr:hypothetical protein [Acidobacteriota bacterium]
MAKTLDSRSGVEFDAFASYVGCGFARLGKLNEAERLWGRASLSIVRDTGLAEVAFMRGDTAAFRKHLRNRLQHGPGYLVTAYLARAGLLAEAEQALRQLETGVVSKPEFKSAQGELAFAHGRLSDAISLLEESTSLLHGSPLPIFWLNSETLAQAWERKGRPDKALEVLARASRQKRRIYPQSANFWMRVELRRAQLLRKMGRPAEAEKVESELRRLLAYADRNHPILRALTNSQGAKNSLPDNLPR